MHNCTISTTKFITDKGVYSFEDFKDGDTIKVLTHTGNFKNAIVRNYGINEINKITFIHSKTIVEEYFTSDHRWLLADGSITTSLKVGDVLVNAPHINFDFESLTDDQKKYWCLGFVLGDGIEAYAWSHGKRTDTKFVRLRLCGNKIKYESRFNVLKHSTKEMDNGDLYLTFSRSENFRKEVPDLDTLDYNSKAALFDGLYCADGAQCGHLKSLFTSNEQIASLIEYLAPALGYYIINIVDHSGEKTNYGICEFVKNYIFIGDVNKYYWKVLNIENIGPKDTWCLEVEDDKSFVLPNGIVTGNCLSIPFDDLLKNGFKTRQTDVRPANSINTACQLVAVIFQIQSLQQFGGVSATHIDWTMVPYIRKSFEKHYLIEYIKDQPEFMDIDILQLAHEELSKWAEKMIVKFFANNDLKDEDFILANKDKLDLKYYQRALYDTTKETYQAVEGLSHNLNTLQSRSGNQLPFTSINYGTCTELEGRLFTKALLEVSLRGLGKFGRTSIFPCGIFQYMKGVNDKPGTPNYDLYQLALKSTAKRLYPNYANNDWSPNNAWIEQDKKDKETYIDNLSEEDKEKLIKKLEENPKLQEILGLIIEEK